MSNNRDIVERLRDGCPGCKRMECNAADEIVTLRAEIALLREERKPVGWCVQAAAGSMVHAGTHSPIAVAVFIQAKDKAEALMLAAVYGYKILEIVEPDEKEVGLG